jgi:four helix bundle protein
VIKSVRELSVYKKGLDLATQVYKVTETFPKAEMFGLVSQMRRAAVSINSNLSEGNARNTTGEYKHFIGIAKGSTAELFCQTEISYKLGFINEKEYCDLTEKIEEILKMLSGLSNKLSLTPNP